MKGWGGFRANLATCIPFGVQVYNSAGPWACTRLDLAFPGELSLAAPVLGTGFHCRCEGSSSGVLTQCIFNSSPTLSHKVLTAVGLKLTEDKCQLDHWHISWDTVSGLCGLQCPWLKQPQPKELE